MSAQKKYKRLQEILAAMPSAIVAYSGGVDSTLLLKVAHDVLGDKMMGVLARSATYPSREYDVALALAKEHGIRIDEIHTEETDILKFRENPPDRCYFCKTELFSKIQTIAQEQNFAFVLDGSNQDDTGDFRPGMRAVAEQHVRSPLLEAQMTKEDIREISKQLGLPTWSKPALACLSSRFPYGQSITEEKLHMVDQAENILAAEGFHTFRCRHYDDTVRIELAESEIQEICLPAKRTRLVSALKKVGYQYITLDLQGYRTGSMNEVLTEEQKSLHIGDSL